MIPSIPRRELDVGRGLVLQFPTVSFRNLPATSASKARPGTAQFFALPCQLRRRGLGCRLLPTNPRDLKSQFSDLKLQISDFRSENRHTAGASAVPRFALAFFFALISPTLIHFQKREV